MREGVSDSGVGWSSTEDPTLMEPPLNLILYMHLRIFAYSSNNLMSNNLMGKPDGLCDSTIDSGTWKNLGGENDMI